VLVVAEVLGVQLSLGCATRGVEVVCQVVLALIIVGTRVVQESVVLRAVDIRLPALLFGVRLTLDFLAAVAEFVGFEVGGLHVERGSLLALDAHIVFVQHLRVHAVSVLLSLLRLALA